MSTAKLQMFSPHQLRRATWAILVLWTLAVAASAYWNAHLLREAMADAAENDARSDFETDARYLLHPDAMNREVHALKADADGTLGHITSLHPKNPENAPDAWEAAALRAFAQGQTEAIARVQTQGQPYVRFMKPVFTQAACLQCHGDQGYRVGDIRGGISVAVPLEPYLAMAQVRFGHIAMTHAGMWILGVLGIFLGTRQLRQRLDERRQAEMALRESEERYTGLVESAFDGSVLHQDGVIVAANAAYAAMFGYQLDELIGKPVLELSPPDARDRVAKTIREESETPYETFGLRKDGSRFPIETAGHVCRFQDRPARMAAVRDISLRQQAETALRESEARFRTVLESVALIGLMLDRAGRITLCNDHLLALTGATRAEVLGADWFERFLPPDVRDHIHRELFLHALATGELPARYENEIVTRSGERRLIAWSNTIIRDSAGQIAGVACIGEDITARQQAETALRESEAKFRLLSEDSIAGVVIIREGRFDYVNPAMARMAGWSREELLAAPSALEFVVEEDRAMMRENLGRRLSGELNTVAYSVRGRRKNGTVAHLEVLGSRVILAGVPVVMGTILDITERRQVEAERERVIGELQKTLAENKTLSGLIPICSGCKKIRDDNDDWKKVEVYIHEHTGARFTHGICPECVRKYYPEYSAAILDQAPPKPPLTKPSA